MEENTSDFENEILRGGYRPANVTINVSKIEHLTFNFIDSSDGDDGDDDNDSSDLFDPSHFVSSYEEAITPKNN